MMNNMLKKAGDLSTAEKRALVARLLREKEPATRARVGSVQRMFGAQAAKTPDSVAVAFEDDALTYRALDARANQLAHYLRAQGIGPETLVGLCVDRSLDMIVGLLGILKAGGAYVPLDPEYPRERLGFMLEDSRVPLLLTQESLRAGCAGLDAKVVCLDSDWGTIARESDRSPAVAVVETNLAYVIYTSGSTGRPKGVQVTHGALANFLRSLRQIVAISGTDALVAVTTLSFDIAALELFLPLTVGARVILVSRDVASDGSRLSAAIARSGVTFLQGTPATWRLLLEAGWEGTPGLTMLCGGEALPRELAGRLLGRGASLWNLYGPTETTIWSSAARVETGEGPVSIGRPIADTQLYVLDGHLRPVPLGVAGELYIGGAGLARGYLGRPGLTAERFLPDPLGEALGGRIYRTGDLARWRPGGRLECLGRVDHQVKIRGFRIELGEVESVLLRQPRVREAVAVAREDASGENRLIAYVVPRAAEGDAKTPALAVADLRQTLEQTLPEPMVPSAFVCLEALPLTPNGKVDREALPAPDAAGTPLQGAAVGPRGPIEEALADTWSEVLGRDRISVHESFFDLGGHSLLAARLLARLRETFAVELPLRALFEMPTVAGQARRIEEALRDGSAAPAPPLRPVPRDTDPPASFAQQRLWFLDQLEPGSAYYNIPMALRLSGPLDAGALERALSEIVRRHESLRTTFRAEGGRPLQVIAPGSNLEFLCEDLTALPEPERQAEVARRIGEEAKRPFDLARGPLIRASLLRLDEHEHVAIVNLHHIVADGWSLGVLLDEAAALYGAFVRALPSPLAPLPLQYADYAVWQREWLQGDVLSAQLDYWKQQLADVPVLEMPTDRPRPSTWTTAGGERTRILPKSLLAGLRALGRQENATLFMTLLAAFETLLHRHSGQDGFAVGTTIAGRSRSETENLIGFFVNTLVLRADLAGEPSFRTLLGRARQTALGAFAHQDLPFEQLVEVLRPARDPSRTPLFQTMLVLQNASRSASPPAGLTMTPIDAVSGTAKFELTLFVTETDDGLKTVLEYNSDLFDAATIERMLGHFETLLEAIVADPDQAIGALPILSETERRELLGTWDGLDESMLSDDEIDSLLTELPLEEATDE